MRHELSRGSLLLLLCLLAGSLAAVSGPGPTSSSASKATAKSDPDHAPEDVVLRRLARRVYFAGFSHPDTTLEDALDTLTAEYGLRFEFNEEIVSPKENGPSLRESRICWRTPLPPMRDVPVREVLRRILCRVDESLDIAYTVRRDRIEITTHRAQVFEVWGPTPPARVTPLVHAPSGARPLLELLRDLAEQADYNLVIDPRVTPCLGTPVSLRLRNTPLDVAAFLASESGAVGLLLLDNTLYATTRERAEILARRFASQRTFVPSPEERLLLVR